MLYLIGTIGFIGGFIFGQMVLFFLLRHKSNAEILADRFLKFKYGLMNWGLAVLGAYSFIETYRYYFGL